MKTKKHYTQPALHTLMIQQLNMICTSREVIVPQTPTNVGIEYGGSDAGYTGGARSRGKDWFDED